MLKIKDELIANVTKLADIMAIGENAFTISDYRKTAQGELTCVIEQKSDLTRKMRFYIDGRRINKNHII